MSVKFSFLSFVRGIDFSNCKLYITRTCTNEQWDSFISLVECDRIRCIYCFAYFSRRWYFSALNNYEIIINFCLWMGERTSFTHYFFCFTCFAISERIFLFFFLFHAHATDSVFWAFTNICHLIDIKSVVIFVFRSFFVLSNACTETCLPIPCTIQNCCLRKNVLMLVIANTAGAIAVGNSMEIHIVHKLLNFNLLVLEPCHFVS